MLKLALLLAGLSWGQTPAQTDKVFPVPEIRECGLVTRYASNKLSPACLQDAYNILYDEDYSISRRNGYSKYNGTPCQNAKTVRGLWPFDATDGTHYMVVLSSQSMFKTSGAGDCAVITGLGSLSATAEMECVQTIGRLWCTNGTDSMFSWDGTSTQTITAAPLGTHIGAFRNRVCTANISGSLTRLRCSGELDGTDWALQVPGRSTTPVSIDISGTNDGNPVSCVMGEYQNAFYIGRSNDLYALYGYDRRDFTLRRISKEIGCTEAKSVQEKNNALYWISKRGVERLTGTQIERVSDPIRPILDNIIQASANTFTKVLTSQADFQGGNSDKCASGVGACMSTTLSPGNVIPSSWSVTESASAPTPYSSSTFVNVSTSGLGIPYIYQTGRGSFINAGAESGAGDFTNWVKGPSSNITNTAGASVRNGAKFGSRVFSFTLSGVLTTLFLIQALDTNGNVLVSTSATIIDDQNWTDASLNLTTQTVSQVKIKVTQYTDGAIAATMTSSATARMDYFPIWVEDTTASNVTPGIDVLEGFNFISTGTMTSQCFSTGLSTPTYGSFTVNLASDTNSAITYQTQVAASCGGSFDSLVSVGNGNRISSAGKGVLKYVSSYTLNSATNTPAFMTSTVLTAATTGYYVSDCATPSSAITSWGNFRVTDVLNNGSFSFWLSTAATCAAAANPATAQWTSQIANSAISVPTGTFIAARVLFSMDSGTQTPTLNDITFEWNEGSARPPTASAVYRDRYWLFYTTSTASGAHNDHVIIADTNDKWTLYDDINAYSATIYNRKLYTGESTATGFIYQQDIGNDDNSGSFTTSFKTSDMDMGNPAERKVLKMIYVFLQPPTDPSLNVQPSFTYAIDGSTTSYSMGTVNLTESPEQSGYFVAKLPVPVSTPSTFHWLNLGMTQTGTVGPLKIYGIKIVFEPVEWE